MLAVPANTFGSSMRSFLGAMEEVELIGCEALLENVQAAVCRLNPDVLMLDADLAEGSPRLNLETYLKDIRAFHANLATIVLVSSHKQRLAALKGMGKQVLLKGRLGDQLRDAIRKSRPPPAGTFYGLGLEPGPSPPDQRSPPA